MTKDKDKPNIIPKIFYLKVMQYNISPKTKKLKAAEKNFLKEKDEIPWIIKPNASSSGRGIYIKETTTLA